MKSFFLGVGIYVLGFIVATFCANIFNPPAEYSYYYGIIFSVLYLAAVVGVCTSLVLKKLDQ